jgi:hypothetical protein
LAEIEELDAKIAAINEQLAQPELASDYVRAMELSQQKNEAEAKQLLLLTEWEEKTEELQNLPEL